MSDLSDMSADVRQLVESLQEVAAEILRDAQQRVGTVATSEYMRDAGKQEAVSDGPSFNNRAGAGTLQVMGGRLARSLTGARTDRAAPETISQIQVGPGGARLTFGSAVPYAGIHERGGQIPVTEAMRGYFWAQYMNTEDEGWKALALGAENNSTFDIPARPFLEPALSDALPEIQEMTEGTMLQLVNERLDT
jgi:phage gpG-like protein